MLLVFIHKIPTVNVISETSFFFKHVVIYHIKHIKHLHTQLSQNGFMIPLLPQEG